MNHIHGPPGNRPKWSVRRMVDKLSAVISPDPLIGREFDGFRIEEKIGKGGMAIIYRARDGQGSNVALKVLNDECSKMERVSSQFMHEAMAVETIRHPNVVRGLGHGLIDGRKPYITMEYIDGVDLHTHIKDERLAPRLTLEIIRQACLGLEAVHRAGIIHRDLKPANIMLSDGRVALIDFGICRPASAKADGEWSGTIYGTINYVAPEQTTGNNHDRRTDIYSLGVTAYRAMCGVLPVEADDLVHLIQLIRDMEPREPSRLVEGLPEAVDRIVMRAMSKRPESRFQTASEMADEIGKFLSETESG